MTTPCWHWPIRRPISRPGAPLYGEIVRRTLDYVLRELRDFQGGFYCGQDADSEGEEGKYYVFTAGELRDLLGPEDAEAFCGWYGVTETGNFAGKNILNLIGREQVQREPVRIRPPAGEGVCLPLGTDLPPQGRQGACRMEWTDDCGPGPGGTGPG